MSAERPVPGKSRGASAENAPGGEPYNLLLCVTGMMTDRSRYAIANVRAICEKYLRGRYVLNVRDIVQEPMVAIDEQVFAAPTLIRKLPEPRRMIIGDFSDTGRVLAGLQLRTESCP